MRLGGSCGWSLSWRERKNVMTLVVRLRRGKSWGVSWRTAVHIGWYGGRRVDACRTRRVGPSIVDGRIIKTALVKVVGWRHNCDIWIIGVDDTEVAEVVG